MNEQLPAGLRASGGAHHRDEITLALAGLRTRMPVQLDLAGITETVGRERFLPSVTAAMEAFQAQEGTGSITRSG